VRCSAVVCAHIATHVPVREAVTATANVVAVREREHTRHMTQIIQHCDSMLVCTRTRTRQHIRRFQVAVSSALSDLVSLNETRCANTSPRVLALAPPGTRSIAVKS
jgi:hypothetical protein